MSDQRVGTCSICGGDVIGFRGVWMSILPPPPDKCSSCGAVARGDIIDMVPMPNTKRAVTTNRTCTDFREAIGESQQEYFGINKK